MQEAVDDLDDEDEDEEDEKPKGVVKRNLDFKLGGGKNTKNGKGSKVRNSLRRRLVEKPDDV